MKSSTRHTHKILALLLAAALLLSLCGCGETEVSGYEIIGTLLETGYVMAFREGDLLADYVSAALSVLAAQGVLEELSRSWLGADDSIVQADAGALETFEEIPQRDFILGFSENSPPMSYASGNGYRGFDINLAQRVCQLLDWNLKFQPVDPDKLSSELLSGNVDAVWGCLREGGPAEGVTLSEPYLSVRFVLVARAGEGLRPGALRGKYLSMGTDAVSAAVLDENAKLRDSLGSISRLTSGSAGCFEELKNGACDVILVPSAAADYYMRELGPREGE